MKDPEEKPGAGVIEKTIRRYYAAGSKAEVILLAHGEAVAAKAQEVARRFPEVETDFDFLYEAAVLHDIGMIETDVPSLGCFGRAPYIHHGIIGRRLLEEQELVRHALVCERHFLTGVSRDDILREGMDLPSRDMLPESWEEKLICYADCFYSKKPGRLKEEKSPERVLKKLPDFCRPVFRQWLVEFREPGLPEVFTASGNVVSMDS
ncbi:HD domain-containing protein [Marispirochaeta aestuarii]|uniref:HD domain-containing protein n=1 Tax=Marispirochaeta aestuarii TaxID=1963862 RepID=UPI0018EA0A33|nr:HD domain-containing protein [Marispirochaeta aestuarii]